MRQQLSDAQRQGRRSLATGLIFVMALFLVFALGDPGGSPVEQMAPYSEQSHRAELARLGWMPADWPAFVEEIRDSCAQPEPALRARTAEALARGGLAYDGWRTSIKAVCPERLWQVAAVEDQLGGYP